MKENEEEQRPIWRTTMRFPVGRAIEGNSHNNERTLESRNVAVKKQSWLLTLLLHLYETTKPREREGERKKIEDPEKSLSTQKSCQPLTGMSNNTLKEPRTYKKLNRHSASNWNVF